MKYLSYLLGFLVVSFVFVNCSEDSDDDYWEDDNRYEENISLEKSVDLGLSVEWASYNVGATSPEEYGGLYGWGDPTGTKTTTDITKYPTPIPPKTIVGTRYDIARKKWGGTWRLPTELEFKELVTKCDWEWGSFRGVRGAIVTGPNGNRLFFPAASFRNGNETGLQGYDGYYWSGVLYDAYLEISSRAFYLYFNHLGVLKWSTETFYNYRSTGHSVRPVRDK